MIILAGIGAGTWLLYSDKQTEGLTAMLTPLGVVAAAFIGTKIAQSREKKRKQ